MNTTTNGHDVNGARFCAGCDAVIEGSAECWDGELMCAACGFARRRDDIENELLENRGELFSVMSDLEERREAYEADVLQLTQEYRDSVANLRIMLETWERRVKASERRLADLDASGVAWLGLAPVAGGAPEFEPSPEDWEDYRRWAEEVDRREELKALEDHHNPMWGYE